MFNTSASTQWKSHFTLHSLHFHFFFFFFFRSLTRIVSLRVCSLIVHRVGRRRAGGGGEWSTSLLPSRWYSLSSFEKHFSTETNLVDSSQSVEVCVLLPCFSSSSAFLRKRPELSVTPLSTAHKPAFAHSTTNVIHPDHHPSLSNLPTHFRSPPVRLSFFSVRSFPFRCRSRGKWFNCCVVLNLLRSLLIVVRNKIHWFDSFFISQLRPPPTPNIERHLFKLESTSIVSFHNTSFCLAFFPTRNSFLRHSKQTWQIKIRPLIFSSQFFKPSSLSLSLLERSSPRKVRPVATSFFCRWSIFRRRVERKRRRETNISSMRIAVRWRLAQ